MLWKELPEGVEIQRTALKLQNTVVRFVSDSGEEIQLRQGYGARVVPQ